MSLAVEAIADLVADVEDGRGAVEVANHSQFTHESSVAGARVYQTAPLLKSSACCRVSSLPLDAPKRPRCEPDRRRALPRGCTQGLGTRAVRALHRHRHRTLRS